MREKIGAFRELRWMEDVELAASWAQFDFRPTIWPVRGPTYLGWADFDAARTDIRRQARDLVRQGHDAVRLELVMNLGTARHLNDLALRDEIFSLQIGSQQLEQALSGTAPALFAGLPVRIDEAMDQPTVQLR